MRWTPRGGHLLLQIRVQAPNDDLRKTFARWFPGRSAEAFEKPLDRPQRAQSFLPQIPRH